MDATARDDFRPPEDARSREDPAVLGCLRGTATGTKPAKLEYALRRKQFREVGGSGLWRVDHADGMGWPLAPGVDARSLASSHAVSSGRGSAKLKAGC